MAKKFDGRQRKIFLYSCNFTMQEKDMLEKKIQKLGGISYTMEDMYVSESTHVIVPDTWARKWTSVIMGAVGSGKFVVKQKYIHDSYEKRQFLPEELYVPNDVESLRLACMKYGRLFENQTCVILLADFRKQMELKTMVRDSGGNVLNWSCKDLALKRDEDILKIHVIYTDLSDVILNDPNYKKFSYKRNTLGRPVEVKSYYCIFKLLSTYPREQDRKFFEKTFDISNKIYMDKLHPIKNRVEKKSFTDFSRRSANIRGQNKPEPKLIVIDSDSGSDIVELTESPPPPKYRNEVEIVNLISDDDEEPEVGVSEMETNKIPKAIPALETPYNQGKHLDKAATIHEPKQSSVELKTTEAKPKTTPTKKTNQFIDFGQTESNSVEECVITNHKPIETRKSSLQNSTYENYSPPASKKTKFLDFDDYKVKKEKAKFIDFGSEDITEQSFSEQNIFPVPINSKLNEEYSKKVVQKPSSITDDTFDQMDIETECQNDNDKKVSVENDLPNCSVVSSRIDKDEEPTITALKDVTKPLEDNSSAIHKEPNIIKPFSFSINEYSLSRYVTLYQQYQEENLKGLDISDNTVKRPYYDKKKDSNLGPEFLHSNQRDALSVELIDIKVSLSQDDDFQDNPILKTLWDLEFIRTSISSRHYVPAANLIKISSSLEDQNMNRAGKVLRNLIIQTFLETLDETVNFHPPTNSVKSEYYNKLFGLDVVRFFNFHFDKYLSYTSAMSLHRGLIEFYLKVLEMELTNWWIYKSKKNRPIRPMIKAFQMNEIQNVVKKMSRAKSDPWLKAIFFKLFAMISAYSSISKEEKSSIKKKNTVKQKLAHAIDNLYSSNQSTKKISIYCNLIRPSWLSTLVLIQRLKCQQLQSKPLINPIDEKLKIILKTILPGEESTMTNLETSDLVIYFAIISKTLETIPVHWISRFILRDKKMLKNEIVKLDLDNQLQKILKSERRSDKRKEEGNSKKSNSKSVYFDNGVGLSQESFKLCLETCIQLMSDVQINSSPTIWQLN